MSGEALIYACWTGLIVACLIAACFECRCPTCQRDLLVTDTPSCPRHTTTNGHAYRCDNEDCNGVNHYYVRDLSG